MNKNSKEKIIAFFLGFAFFLIILEIILKLLSILYINLSNPSQTSFKNNDNVYRIMCIGESTTANYFNHKGYPFFLEKILNEKNLKYKFKVFNLGRPGRQSFALLDELEDNIKKYNPDMVISMMGANDEQHIINYSDFKGRNKSSILNMFQWFKFYKRNKFSINQLDNNLNIPFVDIGMVKSLRLMTKDYFSQEIIDSAKSNIELYDKYKTIFNANINDFYKILEYFENASLDSIQNNKLLFAYSYNVIGDKLFKINELEKAKHYYLRAIHTYPSHYDFYHSMLHKIYSRKDLENLLKKIIDENLYAPWAYANLAKFYREIRMYTSKTIELFEKALELGSDDPSVYATVAHLYAVVGIWNKNVENIDRSEKFFFKALNISPDNLDTIRKKLIIYDFMNVNYRGEERINLLKKKENLLLNFVENLTLKPNNHLNSNIEIHEFYFELGWIYDQLNDFKNAEIFYLRANEIAEKKNITFLELKKKLAQFYLKLNNIDKANYYRDSVKNKGYHSEITKKNYLKLKQILDKYKIKLVAMGYPTRNINVLKSYFTQKEIKGIIFIDNENLFYEFFKKGEYRDYFVDSWYGSFGHTTNKGSKIIGKNIATILEKEFINFK